MEQERTVTSVTLVCGTKTVWVAGALGDVMKQLHALLTLDGGTVAGM